MEANTRLLILTFKNLKKEKIYHYVPVILSVLIWKQVLLRMKNDIKMTIVKCVNGLVNFTYNIL